MRNEIIQKRGYDVAIHGDDLSLTISSYPVTATYLAKRLSTKGKTVAELCCGVGVSAIEFARHFDHVIGVDNDARVIAYAKSNSEQQGITNCNFVVGDISDATLYDAIDADIVAYDIPYWSDHGGVVKSANPELEKVAHLIRSKITENIVIYAPPSMDRETFLVLFGAVEYQQVWINERHDRNFIYTGSLIEQSGITKIEL